MTSSEAPLPPAGAAAPAALGGGPGQVLAEGHLHPAILLLRLLDGLRQALIPVVLGLIAHTPWLVYLGLLLFVLSVGWALLLYVTFRFRLTTQELVTTVGVPGLLHQERRIPQDRIQDLSFESTLLRRLLGLVVVSVETASGQGAEARLDSLARADAERLREALLAARGGAASVALAPPPELLLFQSSAGELSLLGLTNNRIGVILASLVGVSQFAGDLGFAVEIAGWLKRVFGRIATRHWTAVLALAAAAVFLALIAGWLIAITGSFLMFHGYTLTLRNDVLQRRYGLITTRAQALPRRKIQRVLLEQTWLRRLLGLIVVRAESAGAAADPREEVRGGLDVIVPLATAPRAEPLVPMLLPGLDVRMLRWQRVSPRVITRVTLKGLLWTVALLAIGLPLLDELALLALLLVPLSFGTGVLLYSNLAYARAEGHVAMRFGILGRYRAMVPLRKVQAVALRAGPVERALGLARLDVHVAGGAPTVLADLPRDEAEGLMGDLARHAAAARFVW